MNTSMKIKMLTVVIATAAAFFVAKAEQVTYHLERLGIGSMTSGWGTPQINKSIGGNTLRLRVGGESQDFSYGIGTHADSYFEYPVNGKAASFSVRVGVDREQDGKGNVSFFVKDENGNVLAQSGELTGVSDSVVLEANLVGVQTLCLVADKGDSDSDDHADWVDPILTMAEGERLDESRCVWCGPTDRGWDNQDCWSFGAVPTAEQTAVFDMSWLVKMNGDVTVSNVEVKASATLDLRKANSQTNGKNLYVQEMSGDGSLQLTRAGIKPTYTSTRSTVYVNVPRIEIREDGTHDSWFDGGNEEGKRLVVNSNLSGSGYLKCYGNVTLAGDTATTGSILLQSGSIVKRLVVADGQCHLASDSSGTVESIVVTGGTLDFDALRAACPNATITPSVTVDDGSIKVGPQTAITLGTGSSPGVLEVSGTWNDENKVAALDNITLAQGADISRLTVKLAMEGGETVFYSVAYEGGKYVLTVASDPTIYVWTNGNGDKMWTTPGNWNKNAVPKAGHTAKFSSAAEVKLSGSVSVGTVDVAEGATVKFVTTDIWGVHPSVQSCAVTGAGKIQLYHAGIKSSRTDSEPLVIDVAEVEILDAGDGHDSWIEGKGDVPTVINSDLTGSGFFIGRNALTFGGDNSAFTGKAKIEGVGNYNQAERRFTNPAAGFSSASKVEIWGFLLLDFNVGEISFTNLTFRESWGAAIYLLKDAEVTMNVADGSIYNNYQPNVGFQVMERVEGSYARDNATAGCGGFTLRMTGSGTFDNGLSHGYIFEAASGTTSFSFNNTDATYRVKSGAAISGSATIGAVAFESGAKVLQTYDSTTPAMPVLTLTGDYDVSGVLFGVTNPADLPAATKEATPFTMLTATGTLSGAPTTDAIYKPEGSAAGIKWVAAKSDNSVVLKAAASGFIVVVY
jgi:hypothetical protein